MYFSQVSSNIEEGGNQETDKKSYLINHKIKQHFIEIKRMKQTTLVYKKNLVDKISFMTLY